MFDAAEEGVHWVQRDNSLLSLPSAAESFHRASSDTGEGESQSLHAGLDSALLYSAADQ